MKRAAPKTYFGRALIDAEPAGGRIVTGATPVAVPPLPANSPWARDPVPPEPPLGEPLNAFAPVGSPREIAASMQRAAGEGTAGHDQSTVVPKPPIRRAR